MISPVNEGGGTPPKHVLDYVHELMQKKNINHTLSRITEEFVRFWLKAGSPIDKQKAWNNTNIHLRQLEYDIRSQIRSDRNRDGFAVDLGG